MHYTLCSPSLPSYLPKLKLTTAPRRETVGPFDNMPLYDLIRDSLPKATLSLPSLYRVSILGVRLTTLQASWIQCTSGRIADIPDLTSSSSVRTQSGYTDRGWKETSKVGVWSDQQQGIKLNNSSIEHESTSTIRNTIRQVFLYLSRLHPHPFNLKYSHMNHHKRSHSLDLSKEGISLRT